MDFFYQMDPKNVNGALINEHWFLSMQEELNQFKRNNAYELVLIPNINILIGTKWVFQNKLDKNGIILRNKARLVAKWYSKQEDVDVDERYYHVARL